MSDAEFETIHLKHMTLQDLTYAEIRDLIQHARNLRAENRALAQRWARLREAWGDDD